MGHELHVANKNRWILYVYQEKDTFLYQSVAKENVGEEQVQERKRRGDFFFLYLSSAEKIKIL